MKTSILLIWLLCATSSLSAERVVRIIYYESPSNAPTEAVLYGASGQFTEIKLPRWNMSNPAILPDTGEDFFLVSQVLPQDASIPPAAPRIKIPSSWETTVLLVSPNANNVTLPIKVTPVNASPSVFGNGEILWINMSEIVVGGQIGDQKLLIKPRSVELMKAPKDERGDYPVSIDCVVPGERKLRWLVRQTWRHNPTARQLVFIQPMDPPRIASLYSVSFYD